MVQLSFHSNVGNIFHNVILNRHMFWEGFLARNVCGKDSAQKDSVWKGINFLERVFGESPAGLRELKKKGKGKERVGITRATSSKCQTPKMTTF